MAATADGLKRPYHVRELIDQLDSGTTLADALTALQDAAADAGRTYECPKCKTTGKHAHSLDTGDPADTELVECTMVSREGVDCSGWGYTMAAVKAEAPERISYVNA